MKTKNHDALTSASTRIHTSQIEIPTRNGLDLSRDCGDHKPPKFVTEWRHCVRHNKPRVQARFNPNASDACLTLGEYERRLTAWGQEHGFERSDFYHSRADFAVDCFDPIEAEHFKKLCDLVVYTFIVKHRVSARDMYWGMAPLDEIQKNLHARKRHFMVERYFQKIQDPHHGAIWRFELRNNRNLNNQPKNDPAYLKALLEDTAQEIGSLPSFYNEAIQTLALKQSDKFKDLQATTADKLSRYQFLLERNDRVFSREQVRLFLENTGVDNVKDKADYFADEYPKLFISRKEFKTFIDELKQRIAAYIGNA